MLVRLRPGLLLITGMVLMALIQSLVSSNETRVEAVHAPPAVEEIRETKNHSPSFRAAPPWGVLEKHDLILERPDEFVADWESDASHRWFFGGRTLETLPALLHSFDLAPAEKGTLLNRNLWTQTGTGVVVHPPEELILSLSASSRERIYNFLGRFPENPFQHNPYKFHHEQAERWLAHSGLSEETLEIIQGFLYRRGEAICFSDLEVLKNLGVSDEEEYRLRKTLGRVSSLMLQLHVEPGSDIEALAGYWGKGPYARDVRVLLQSLAQMPEGAALDVVHLLPPVPRVLLYTFPPAQTGSLVGPDCYWSALNFFNETPDDRYLEEAAGKAALRENYFQVFAEPQFGDLIALVDQDDIAIHVCVFIADNVVFTKNGGSRQQPWILMEFQEMLAIYQMDKPLRILKLRPKMFA